MSPIRAILALAAVLVLSTPAYADPRSFVYTTIEYPGATFTQAFGVNAAGDVVGTYRDASGRQHGFLLSAGVYTSIDYPGAVLTDARGIGPGGEIVGAYRLAGEPGVAIHGYLRARDGQFTPLDFPGHLHTIPQRLLANGTIVGCYHDGDTMQSMHGMTMSRSGVTDISADASMHNGGTPDGSVITGLYTDMMSGRGRGYLIDRHLNFIPFDVPGSTFTAAWDMNALQEIVGVYRDASGGFHGFVAQVRDWSFRTIDVPGARATRAFGINAGGDVVGSYVNASGRTYAFLASRTAQHSQ